MKRSRHYQGAVANRAAFRQLSAQEQAKTRALRLDRIKRAKQQAVTNRERAIFTTPEQRRAAIASTILHKGERKIRDERGAVVQTQAGPSIDPRTGMERNESIEQFPDGLRAPGQAPSKDHLPYIVAAIVSREARVHVTSRFDHFGVMYPVDCVWSTNPYDAIRQAGANSRQYRAMLAPEAYRILADRRKRKLEAAAQARSSKGQFTRKQVEDAYLRINGAFVEPDGN